MTEREGVQRAPTITIRKLATHPEGENPSYYYHTNIHRGGILIAEELLGSEQLLEIFLRGIRAGCMVFGVYLPDLEIPTVAEPVLSLKDLTKENFRDVPF